MESKWFSKIFNDGLLPGLPLSVAMVILYKRCMSYISDSSEGSNRTLGIVFLCVGIVTAIIAGPVRSNGEEKPIVARFVKTGHSGSRRRTLRYKVTVDLQ